MADIDNNEVQEGPDMIGDGSDCNTDNNETDRIPVSAWRAS